MHAYNVKDGEVLTGVNGKSWKANQDEEEEEENEVEEEVDTNAKPFHCAIVVERYTRVIVYETHTFLPKPVFLIEAPYHCGSSYRF